MATTIDAMELLMVIWDYVDMLYIQIWPPEVTSSKILHSYYLRMTIEKLFKDTLTEASWIMTLNPHKMQPDSALSSCCLL